MARLESPSTRSLEPAESGVRLPVLTTGTLGGRPVSILVTGDGAARSRRGVRVFLQRSSATELLVVGVAGGLTTDLGPADLVVAAEVISADGRRFESRHAETERTARLTGARVGTVVTASALALSAEEKRRLRELAVPGRGHCVVDLETAEYVAAAEGEGVAWEVIRAVSDAASEDLPDFLSSCAGPDGEIRRSSVVKHAARHPSAIPELLRLRRRLDRCSRSLARAAASWVCDGSPEALHVAAS